MSTALRDKLSALQRGPGRPAKPKPAAAPARHHADSLSAELDARVTPTPHGEVLVWEKRLSEVWSQGGQVAQALWAAFDDHAGRRPEMRELGPFAETDPSRIGWVDIETAGFMGRPIFLVGVMRVVDGDLVITQFLARDYARERAMLSEFAGMVEGLQVLVTFNGKCFDLPFLRDRMAYHRVPHRMEGDSVDLLWAARRRWKGEFPDCRLQTLERHLCRRLRPGDIPGMLIPQRYHDFVRSQDAGLMAPIMRHNRLDLLTMVELSALLLGEV